jgi:hypothetical protein
MLAKVDMTTIVHCVAIVLVHSTSFARLAGLKQ